MKISVAITPREINQFRAVEIDTVKELGKLACESNISTSIFKDGYRKIANFESADLIGLDIDNNPERPNVPILTVEQAKEAFKDYKHLILATQSHQKDKHGVIADRFRVILFLESPITDANDFYATWHELKKAFPAIDDQCKDPSRFWYKHSGVLGFGLGKLVQPTKYVAPEPKAPVLAEPGERGKLSKQTLEYLALGIPIGHGLRNGGVYKMAKDFQQNLYSLEEAQSIILEALERTRTLDNRFSEAEAQRTIESAYTRDPKHDPRLGEKEPNSGNSEVRAFSYMGLKDILEIPDKPEDWLVEGLLIRGGMSLLVGIPKIGKSTLVRQLERSALRGEPFLGRKCQKVSVLHYSFDEKARTAKRHYRALGLTGDDPLYLHFGAALTEEHLKHFEEDLLAMRPGLVVVDTLFDMASVESINDYIPIKQKLTVYGTIAEKTGSHILFIHHQTKPNKEYGRASGNSVLGSQAIFGAVDCCMIFERIKDSKLRTIAVEGRGIEDFEKTQLRFSREKQIYIIEQAEDPF